MAAHVGPIESANQTGDLIQADTAIYLATVTSAHNTTVDITNSQPDLTPILIHDSQL
jgi:hypothetical protein